MTDEEISSCFTALGKAFAERRDLRPERTRLHRRLAAWGLVFTQLAENPQHQETLDELEAAIDEGENPLEVWKAFQKAEQRLAELDKLLADR